MCSLCQIYVESSLLAYEGAMSGFLFARMRWGCSGNGTGDEREMFQLMYFPVGRKTHVVAFNLIRVTLRPRVVLRRSVFHFPNNLASQ